MPGEELFRNGYIGSDESGKGDYFGPLVIAAVAANAEALGKLKDWGVRDSKALNDKKISELSRLITDNVPYEIVAIGPEKYNNLYNQFENLNKLMAWAHARAIENLRERVPDIDIVIVDKFGPERRLLSALGEGSRGLRIIQETKAERYPAVAAASIVAREEFVRRLSELSERFGVLLPKGATHVIDAAREVYLTGGVDLLSQVAKLHFKTTAKVVNGDG